MELNKNFKPKYGIEIDIGIGLHIGDCRVGNMGSSDLFDYTIIGDNVNLTSRLEGLTKYYGVKLMISESLKHHLEGAYRFQELDRVRVKGKSEPVAIFTVYPGNDPMVGDEELAAWQEGLDLYKAREFDRAKEIFSRLAETFEGRKCYRLYVERCEVFIDTPPEADWDGVFTHTSK